MDRNIAQRIDDPRVALLDRRLLVLASRLLERLGAQNQGNTGRFGHALEQAVDAQAVRATTVAGIARGNTAHEPDLEAEPDLFANCGHEIRGQGAGDARRERTRCRRDVVAERRGTGTFCGAERALENDGQPLGVDDQVTPAGAALLFQAHLEANTAPEILRRGHRVDDRDALRQEARSPAHQKR